MRTLNLGVVAHVDAGKTTLTERLLFDAGVIDTFGSVDAGSTQTDSMELERQRGITIRSAVVSFQVGDVAVNLIDTPGHPDFIAEVERALAVLDACVLVLSAVEGVQAQTVLLMRALRRLEVPTALFVNKIDRAGADPTRVVAAARRRLSPSVVPLGTVVAPGTRAARFSEYKRSDPRLWAAIADAALDAGDETLVELAGLAAPTGDAWDALSEGVARVRIHPVMFGSAITGAGCAELARALTELMPASEPSQPDAPLSAAVFKVDRDDRGQRTAYVRVYSGSMNVRDSLGGRGRRRKITDLRVFDRGKWKPVASVIEGQIGRVWGIDDLRVGDTVGAPAPEHQAVNFARPALEATIASVDPTLRPALDRALRQLADQDPLISLRYDEAEHELLVSLYGEVQKEVIHATLMADYGIEVQFGPTTTVCVERPVGTGSSIEHIWKNPFLATVGLNIAPAPTGSGIRFEVDVELSSVPMYVYNTTEAFREAMAGYVRDTLRHGLFGWEVTDCIVTMTDCAYAPPGTNAGDYRKLTPLVLMDALRRAQTVVCEPIHHFSVEAPADALGPLLPVLARLGAVASRTAVGSDLCTVEGSVPAARVRTLQQQLPGLTHGEGVLEAVLDRYERVRGQAPRRARPAPDPLNRKQYLATVRR